MRKICMVTTSEIFHDTRIINEATTLAKKCTVTVLARRYHGQKPLPFSFQIKLINYQRMPLFQWNIFSSLLSLAKAAWRENPDIFHAHDLDGLLCAFPAALLKGKILIYDSHELWSNTYPFANLRGIQWLLPILEGLLIRRVKAGITVNESLAQYLSKKYRKKFLSLRNLPVRAKNQPGISLRELFGPKKIILHLGAADEGRGMEEMVKSVQYLPENYILVFLGGGKTESQIKKMTKELKLSSRIKFLPAVLPSQIAFSIKEADLGLVLTQKDSLSYYLSLPNKIFQYLNAGLPILGSNFPEFRKVIIANRIGEVVDPAKTRLIAQKIIKMTQTKLQKKYRRNLENLGKNQYNWEAESNKLLNFYAKF